MEPHYSPNQTHVCQWCFGEGHVKAKNSTQDEACPDCRGWGEIPHPKGKHITLRLVSAVKK